MKARLQKQQAYKYKEKPHFKHVIVVPEEAVAKLGWKGGEDLELDVSDGQLVISANKNIPNKENGGA